MGVFRRNASLCLAVVEKFPFGVYMVLASSRWPGTRLKSHTEGHVERRGSRGAGEGARRGLDPAFAQPQEELVCSPRW